MKSEPMDELRIKSGKNVKQKPKPKQFTIDKTKILRAGAQFCIILTFKVVLENEIRSFFHFAEV